MVAVSRVVRSGRSARMIALTAPSPAPESPAPGRAAVLAALAAALGDDRGPLPVAVPQDVDAAALPAALAGAEVVVHLATPTDLAADLHLTATQRRARAVRAVQDVAAAADGVGARRLVVVTSTMVYGAHPDNPVPLEEGAALRAARDDGVVGDLLEVERIVARVPRLFPRLACTVVRPAPLVGPGVDTFVTRHFETPRLLALRGHEMVWQFCHVDDLASAVATAVERDLDGVLTAGCLPGLPGEEVARLAGMRRTELPAALAFRTAERLHRHGLLATPAAYLSYVVHPCVIGAERLVEAGWRPRRPAEECVRELVAEAGARASGAGGTDEHEAGAASGRRAERREAALGAAGAAVAIVGTAALLRQARSRRGGGRRRSP